jgi:hypothetical protein
MQIYSLDIEDMTQNANIVKEAMLAVLEKEGLLKKPAHEIAAEYAVIISKPGWLGQLFKGIKVNTEDSNKLRYDVVKSV